MKLKADIRFRLFLLSFIPAGITVLCLLAYVFHSQKSELEKNLNQQGTLIAQQVAIVVTINNIQKSRIRNFLTSLIIEHDVLAIKIFDDKKQLFASIGKINNELSKNTVVVIEKKISGDTTNSSSNSSASPSPAIQKISNYNQTGTAPGYIKVFLSKTNTVDSQRLFLTHSVIIALSGLILTLLIVDKIARKISHPILNLTHTVSSITQGNLGTRAKLSGTQEIQTLQRGFNSMASAMQKNQAHLERKIYNATVRLQHTLRSLEDKNLSLEESRKQAISQNKLKSQFLAHVSHEIRTPMNGIMGFIELLSKSELMPDQSDQLQLIETSAENLLEIINEILDLATLESEEFTLKPKNFRLRPYLEDSVSLLAPQAKNSAVTLLIEKDFPTLIHGDPIRIQQVITNLVGNAMKFTPKGRIIIRAQYLKLKSARFGFLSISDTGCGISKEDQINLFSPFPQMSDFDVNPSEGTGLGLTISKSIVERMNGRIGVMSRPGQGSTFWVLLPLRETKQPEKVNKNFSVVLIDATKLSRAALESQLIALGVHVLAFPSIKSFVANFSNSDIANTVFIYNPQTEPEYDDKKPIETIYSVAKNSLLLVGNQPQSELLKTIIQEHSIKFLKLPCRSSFLSDTLQSILQPFTLRKISPPVTTTPEYINHTFLVSDDNDINRALLKSQLSQTGAVILEARDGKETLELLNAVAFDLIFLDLQMPIMNGMEIMRHLVENENINQSTPVVAVTAHALPDQQAGVLAAGFSDCLIKPLLKPRLEETMRRCLDYQSTHSPTSETSDLSITSTITVQKALDRTEGDIDLACVLLDKLFAEIPDQLEQISKNISVSNYADAKEITHRLHGSLSFFDFSTIKLVANKLETTLNGQSATSIKKNFSTLKIHLDHLMSLQTSILSEIKQIKSNSDT